MRINIEVVKEFKLLGIFIDNKLTFATHIKQLKKAVNKKLYAIRNLFFLSYNIKLQFFKSFILPHFDYCNSIFIFLTKNLINSLASFYNTCLFILLKIKIKHLDLEEQQKALCKLNLFPFKYRIFYRFCLFSYKILRGKIMKNINSNLVRSDVTYELRENTRNILDVPFARKKEDRRESRLSYQN